MKAIKKALTMILIITLINIIPIISNVTQVEAANVVDLSLTTQPYIDVVLSKGKTATDLTNFKTSLTSALRNQNVDTSKVKISAIEAQTVNIEEAFEWQQDVSSSIGSISIVNNGQDVTMVGNRRNSGKNAIWIIPPKDLEQTFTFSYNISYGDSFNAAGMLLRVKQIDSSTLKGYMISFNNSSGDNWSGVSGSNGAIWEFTYGIGQNSTNFTKTLKKPLNISTSGTLTVKATRNEIEISGGGLAGTEVYELEDSMGTGFGFFSDHYSHNCDEIGGFTLTGINLKTESVKKVEEVLREPDWREDAIKVLVDVSDVSSEQLNAPSSLGELLNRMINDEIYYVGWGKTVNRTQINNLIAANNNNGKFISNTSYSSSITQTAQYIKSLIPTNSGSNYVILGENTILSSTNSSLMTNTAGGAFPYGRWRVVHDCEYFENNIGQFAQSGGYMSNMITSFDKTGKYDIYYEDTATNPATIYVHRKPIAEINVQRNGNTVTLTSLSYDSDKQSTNNGIQQEEWKYRQVGTTTWTTGKLTNISGGTNYLVQLRVKDYQNTWSAPITKYITKTSTVPPIASFNIVNKTNSVYEPLQVIDGSYDPYGGTITRKTWKVYKGETLIYTGTTPLTNYNASGRGVGNYTMTLEVTNNRGITSEAYKRNFTIIPDNEAPEFTATPTDCEWATSVTVNLQFKDRLGSGFKNYQYAITTSQTTPTNWKSGGTNANSSITINESGTWYLHVKATDNAGNTSQHRAVGPYHIDVTNPTGTTSHSPTKWVNTDVNITWSFSDEPSGIKTVKLPDGTTTTNASGTYTVTTNGSYTFIGYDYAGNQKSITETITNIDKNEPRHTVTHTPTDWVIDYVNISWEFTEPEGESKVKNVQLPDGTTTTNTSGTYTVRDNGNYTFIATDNAGNVKTVTETINNIDKIKPDGILTSSYTGLTDEPIQINWEAVDSQSGFEKIILPNGIESNQATGTYRISQMGTYQFTIYDKVGNERTVAIQVNNVDMKAPYLEIKQNLTRWTNEDLVLNWKAYDNESGLKEILFPNGQKSTNPEGEYAVKQNGIYTFLAYDQIGNGIMVKHEVTNIDKTAPTLKLKSEYNNNGNIKIKWEMTDTQSGVRNITLPNGKNVTEKTGEFEVSKNGTYSFIAYDNVGNDRIEQIQINGIDKQGIRFNLYQEKIDENTYKIRWEVEEGQEDFKNIILPDNTVAVEKEGYFTVAKKGTYTFLAYDKTGNETKCSITITK